MVDPGSAQSVSLEFAVSARAALRCLPALYALQPQQGNDAELFATEVWCLLGLYSARASAGGQGGPSRQAIVDLSSRVLSSLYVATDHPRTSLATLAAFYVRHGFVHDPSPALTNRVVALSRDALRQLNPDLGDLALRAGGFDRAFGGSLETLLASPLWPDEPLLDVGPAVMPNDVVRQLVCRGPLGSGRWQSWYALIVEGNVGFIHDLGDMLEALLDHLGPPREAPGESAVYGSGDFLGKTPLPLRHRQHAKPPDYLSAPRPLAASAPEYIPAPKAAAPTPTLAAPRPGPVSSGPVAAQHVVNTGFARCDAPEDRFQKNAPLPHASNVYFWLEVGEPQEGSIEQTPTAIPWEELPSGARLTVALFGFGDGLEIQGETGELALAADGRTVVVRQPGLQEAHGALGPGVMLFPLRTPAVGSDTRLRCNIYYQQVLVQSRLVVARLGDPSQRVEGARVSTLDYKLMRSLRSETLAGLAEHTLSVMLNDGKGSHQFRFFGQGPEPFVNDASLGEAELDDLLETNRRTLRQVAWGAPTEWVDQTDRYPAPASLQQLETDLVALAVQGFRFYDALARRLSKKQPKLLRELMRRPGRVQFTARRSARDLVPASLIYDRLLLTAAPTLSLCPAFKAALAAGRPLALEPCFAGDCPHEADNTIVCPSGFWGFRHELGIPVSLADEGEDEIVTRIDAKPAPAMAMCVSTDPQFVRRAGHELKLRELFSAGTWQHADSFDGASKLLAKPSSHLVYFYCHGGYKDSTPYILVGNGPGLTRADILALDWDWRATTPLVFINGCHTTALQPSHAFDLVTGFIETAGAAAVVGTEITIFEPLACAFAEAFMDAFVRQRQELGAAVRLARLRLLEQRNPLGLVYLPFGVASLKLT